MLFSLFTGLLFLFLLGAGCRGGGGSKTATARGDSVLHSEMLRRVTDSIHRYPDSSQLYFERGGLLYVMKEYELAGKDIEKAISLDPLKTDYYISLGEIAMADGALPRAEHAYRKALQLDASSMMARLQLTYVLIQQQQYHQALEQADSLLKQDDGIVQAYGLKAQALEALKDTAGALGLLKKAVTLAPGNYDALMATGDLLLRSGDTAALGFYRRAALADTTQGEPLYCIGLVEERSGSTGRAVDAYKACITRDAYYLDAYLRIGAIREQENDWKDALKIYTLATKIDPTSAEAFYHRGVSEEKLNRLAEAKSDYRDAVDLKGDHQAARAALERLNQQDSR